MKFNTKLYLLVVAVFILINLPAMIQSGFPLEMFLADIIVLSLLALLFWLVPKFQTLAGIRDYRKRVKKFFANVKAGNFVYKAELEELLLSCKLPKSFSAVQLSYWFPYNLSQQEVVGLAEVLRNLYLFDVLNQYYKISKNGILFEQKFLTPLEIPKEIEFLGKKVSTSDFDVAIHFEKNYNV